MVQLIPIMCQICTVEHLAMAVVLVSIALVGPWQANAWIIIVSGLLRGISRQVWGLGTPRMPMWNTAIHEELRREIPQWCGIWFR